MDLLTLIKLIARRWYVVVPVMAASVAFAVWMQFDVEREYEAQGTLLLSPPEFDPARAPSVPAAMASAVQELRTSQGRQSIVEAGGSDDFTLSRLEGSQVQVTVPGDDADAILTAELVTDSIARSIADEQVEAGIPTEEQIQWTSLVGVEVVEAAEEAEVDQDSPPVTNALLVLEDPTAGRSNPFAAGEATSRLLQYAVQSDAGRSDVFQRVGHPAFRGFFVAPERGPGLITVSTSAGDPTVAIESFDAVRSALEDELDARQDRADVPTSQRLAIEVIATPGGAIDVTPPVDRGSAAIIALGGGIAVGMVIIVENVAYRRRLRRNEGTSLEVKDLGTSPSDRRSEQTLGSH